MSGGAGGGEGHGGDDHPGDDPAPGRGDGHAGEDPAPDPGDGPEAGADPGAGRGPESNGPRVVESVAVDRADLVAAHEHNRRRGGRPTVLRLTPPFHARMRARLHRPPAGGDGSGTGDEDGGGGGDAEGDQEGDERSEGVPLGEPAPVEIPPERLLSPDAPAPPTPDATEDGLRADPDAEYDVAAHRERHAAALEEWRAAIAGAVRDRVEVKARGEGWTVAVTVLG